MNAIRTLNGSTQDVSTFAYVDPAAQLIGRVQIGDQTSVWPGSVIRADTCAIRIGARSNIQDGALLHVTRAALSTSGGFGLSVGNNVTIGHAAVLDGCVLQDAILVGADAMILDRVLVKRHCIIGAGAVVMQGSVLGEGGLWLGNPACYIRALTAEEIEHIYVAARQSVVLSANYRAEEKPRRSYIGHEFDRRSLRI